MRYARILMIGVVIVTITGTAHLARAGKTDSLVEALCRVQRKALSEPDTLADFRFRSPNQLDEMVAAGARRATLPDDAVMKRLGELTDDVSLKKSLSALDDPWQRKLVVELGETAGDVLRHNADDGAIILRNMDKEGLVFCRTFPTRQRLLEEMYRDSAEATTVLQRTGRYGLDFYEKYVKNHKKKWIAAGALAVFFSNPEYFIREGGELTEYAIEKLGELGISVAGGAGRSIRTVAEKTWRELLVGFFFGSIWGVLVLVVLIAVLTNWLGTQFGLKRGWLIRWPLQLIFGAIRRKTPENLQQDVDDVSAKAD